jgi:CheY-like chemotaxis protein
MSLQELDRFRILVVDDNLPSAELVQAFLGRSGLHSVKVITDPRAALDQFEDLAPDLVILDLHMPGLDGYAVLAELRRRADAADLPVLVLTADTTREATHRALELGASDFLTKPLDATELVLRVGNLLEAHALHIGLLRRHRWLEASAQLSADLLSGDLISGDLISGDLISGDLISDDLISGDRAEPLRRVCELAREAAGADIAVLATPGPASTEAAPQLVARIWVGDRTDAAADAIAAAFTSGRFRGDTALLTDALDDRPDALGPVMLVPLIGRDGLLGALLLARRSGSSPFLVADLPLAQGFAAQAAIAVELAAARAEKARMLVLADRHRIARDLHDQVIQRLFATGLQLQQVADRMEPGPIADRIGEHVDDLDDTITEIRSTIFGLRQANGADPLRVPDLADDDPLPASVTAPRSALS